jgi:hypothetical protein
MRARPRAWLALMAAASLMGEISRGEAIVGRFGDVGTEIGVFRRCGDLKESSVTGAYTSRGRVASSTGTEIDR